MDPLVFGPIGQAVVEFTAPLVMLFFNMMSIFAPGATPNSFLVGLIGFVLCAIVLGPVLLFLSFLGV